MAELSPCSTKQNNQRIQIDGEHEDCMSRKERWGGGWTEKRAHVEKQPPLQGEHRKERGGIYPTDRTELRRDVLDIRPVFFLVMLHRRKHEESSSDGAASRQHISPSLLHHAQCLPPQKKC